MLEDLPGGRHLVPSFVVLVLLPKQGRTNNIGDDDHDLDQDGVRPAGQQGLSLERVHRVDVLLWHRAHQAALTSLRAGLRSRWYAPRLAARLPSNLATYLAAIGSVKPKTAISH